MKKFFVALCILTIMLNFVGCSVDNQTNTNANINNSFVKEQNYGLVFNTTQKQFINNYNNNLEKLSDYGSINLSDYLKRDEGTGRFNTVTSERFIYNEPITSSYIAILKDKKSDYVTSVYLMLKTYTELSDLSKSEWFIYGKIIQAINPQMSEDNINEIIGYIHNSQAMSTYKNNMVFYAIPSLNGIILGVDALDEFEYTKIVNK